MRRQNKSALTAVTVCLLLWGCLSHAFAAEPFEFIAVLTLKGRPDAPVFAKAEFILAEDENALRYTLTVTDVEEVTMSHIHLGKIGDLNTPVVWLYPPGPPPKKIQGPFTGLLAEGEITARDLIGPLRGRPLSALVSLMRREEVFVNIHAKRSAAGEICGQLKCLVR